MNLLLRSAPLRASRLVQRRISQPKIMFTTPCSRPLHCTASSPYAASQVDAEDADDFLDISRFGDYNLVLSDNPTARGVSHIALKTVPDHIVRPPYALSKSGSPPSINGTDSRIVLGSGDEARLRAACKLARQTLTYGHSLVRVRGLALDSSAVSRRRL